MSALERAISHIKDLDAPRQGAVAVGEAQDLDGLCRAIATLSAGADAADPDALQKGLAAVERVGQALAQGTLPPDEGAHWQAYMASLPLTGGRVLKLEDREGAQELTFHLDGEGALYLGSWASLKPESEGPGVLFAAGQGASGWELRVSDGAQERRMPLGANLPGFAWSRAPAFAEQSEGRAGLDELLHDLAQTLVQVPTTEATEQPPVVGLTCSSCGATVPSDSRFCNRCGAPLGCPSCGNICPPGSRFCNYCGQRLASES